MIIAIDPGKSGGIAVHNKAGKTMCFPMPQTDGDVVGFFDDIPASYCDENELIHVVMEKVSGFAGGPGQPGSAMFKFGDCTGFLRGVVMVNKFPVELVTPQKWQKSLSLGTRGKMTKVEWKNKLKNMAQQLYPMLRREITLKTADALLILEYALMSSR